jgi:hypothetical protein
MLPVVINCPHTLIHAATGVKIWKLKFFRVTKFRKQRTMKWSGKFMLRVLYFHAKSLCFRIGVRHDSKEHLDENSIVYN